MEQDIKRAEQLYQDHRYEEALTTYEQAIRQSASKPDPRLYYGQAATLKRLAEQAHNTAHELGYTEDQQAIVPIEPDPRLYYVYQMARLFQAASPPIADPSPEFSAQLYQRLREQMQAPDQENAPTQSHAEADPISPPPDSRDVKKRRGMSRRTLFTSGTIAASLVGGVAIGAAIEHSLVLGPESELAPVPPDLNPHLRGDAWHLVASVDQLGKDPIRFATDTIIGYVIRQTENSAEPSIIAFSAACTREGCIVQWQENKRQFICPCHGGTFDATGHPIYTENNQPHYVSLPRLETKIENGNIYVKVPTL